MQLGDVRLRNINDEMRESYLDYAMSVIVSRALPDARDGLKPVHRRILYAMHTMNAGPSSPYRKSARIVGEVLGKYHPHGDMTVYDAMVRMAQEFSMRYELVDGQGNFGSIDGDGAAAMRYTEARISDIGNRLLDDISKNTVDFGDNFDGSLLEPFVLPTSIPNLLVNGSSGIAVGMSTNIPPHNLDEVCNALIYMLDQWESLDDISIHDLLQFIKGPDFPTGGVVYTHNRESESEDQLISAYATGRGKITVRAKAHLEDLGRGRIRIIITEIPFQTNKSSLLERIATLVQTGKLEGLSDMRDESDREGLRIVLELSRGADPSEVLASLFKYTPLESTFGIIMLALVNGEPRMLSLKQMLRIYIEHRLDVIRRRSEYDLANAEARAHILEGLLIALDDIDKAIDIIRRSRTPDTAKQNLQKAFGITERQAHAILDMRLRRLAQLERKTLKEEHDHLLQFIRDLRMLLSSHQLMRMEIKRELNEIREKYGDYRHTVIVQSPPSDVGAGDLLLPQEETYITLTSNGKLSRTYEYTLPPVSKQAEEAAVFINSGTTADTLHLFTPNGDVATVPVSQINKATDPALGDDFSRLSALNNDDQVVAVISLPVTLNDGYLLFTSRLGEVKRLRIEDIPRMRVDRFSVFDVAEGDELVNVSVVFDGDEVMLITHQAQAIRFAVSDVRPTGLAAGGMRGIKLKEENDYVVGSGVVRPNSQLFVMTADGRGKRSPADEYPTQGRAGGGVRTLKSAKGQANEILKAAIIQPTSQAIIHTNQGRALLLSLEKAPEYKRDYRADLFLALGMGEHVHHLRLVNGPVKMPATLIGEDSASVDELEDSTAPESLSADFSSSSPIEAMLEFGDNGTDDE